MPTTGNVTVNRYRASHARRFDAARLDQLARSGEARRQLRERRQAERERARAVAAVQREQRADRRELLSDLAGEHELARQNARAAYAGLREDPAYGMWRSWAPRMDRGTLYDARAWRTSGRLVPVGEHMRHQGGGRREVIDWTDVLDREAQQVGLDARDLPAHFERLRRQELHARQLAREADERKAEWHELRAAFREHSA